METSYKAAFRFAEVANLILKDQDEKDTKFVAALESVLEQIEEYREEYGKKLAKIQRKFAAEDKFGCLLRDDRGGYRYTRDKEEEMDERAEELFNHPTSVKFEPEYIEETSIPAKVLRAAQKYLTGFVIEPKESDSSLATKLRDSLPTNKTTEKDGE